MPTKHRPTSLDLPSPIASHRRGSADKTSPSPSSASSSSPHASTYLPSPTYFTPLPPPPPPPSSRSSSLRSPGTVASSRMSISTSSGQETGTLPGPATEPGYPFTPPGTPLPDYMSSRPPSPSFENGSKSGRNGSTQLRLFPANTSFNIVSGGASRRGSINPLVLMQRRSKRSFAMLCVLVLVGWLFMTGRATGGGGGTGEDRGAGLLGVAREKLGMGSFYAEDDARYLQNSIPQPMIHARPKTPPTSPQDPSTSSQQFATPSQELSALILFLSSAATNQLPLELSPFLPLPPDSVMEHTLPTDPVELAEELREMEAECWDAMPVVVVGKAGDVWTSESREILRREEYMGKKADGLGEVFVDKRVDSEVLQPLFTRLLSAATPHPSLSPSAQSQPISLPQILIAGRRIGSFDNLKTLHDTGSLSRILADAGLRVGVEKKERMERERKAVYGGKGGVGHGKMKRAVRVEG